MTTPIQAIESLAFKWMTGEVPAGRMESAISEAGLTDLPAAFAAEINLQINHSPHLAHALASAVRELARQAPDPRPRAEADLLFIRTLNALAEFRDAAARCQDAARAFQNLGDDEGAARTWFEAAWAETYLGNLNVAREHLERLRGLIRPETDPLSDARAKWIEGRIVRDQGEYAQANSLFEHARQVLSAAGETLDALRCRRELGHSCTRTDPALALPMLEDLRRLFEQEQCPTEIGLCHYFMAQACRDLNRFQGTLEHLAAARTIFNENQQSYFVADCDLDAGIAYWRLNQYDAALTCLHKARSHFLACGAESEVSSCDIDIGCVLVDVNRYQEAIERFEQALLQAQSSGRRKKAARCFGNMAMAFDQLGRYSDALNYYQRAREEFASQGMTYDIAYACDLPMGRTYLNLGAYAAALATLDQARAVFVEKDLPADLACCELYRAQLFFVMGRRDEALETLEHARALSVQAHQPAYVAYCDRLLAGAWVNPADKSHALSRLEQSHSVFVKYGQPIDAALCDLTRGELHSAWKEWEEADDYLQRARHTLYPGFPDQAWRADYALGKVALGQQNRKAALRHYLDAVEVITNLRAGLGLEQLSNDLFGARQQVFTDGLRLAQNEGDSVEALRVIEASKAQTLFTHLLMRDWRIRDRSGDDVEVADLMRRERELRYQLGSLRRRVSLDTAYSEGEPLLRGGSVDMVPAEKLGEIDELSRTYESIVARLRLAKRGLSGVPSLAPFSIAPFREMAQARWGNRWAALDYNLAGDDLTIAYLDPEEVKIESMRLTGDDYSVLRRCAGTNPDLRELVYRGLGGDKASPVSARYLRHLADKLIPAKLRASTEERTLIIAPHGPLHHLPFHALMEGDNYLVDRFDFLYTPSLQTLTQLDHDARGTGGRSQILLFGLDDFGARARPLKHTAQEILALRASGNGKVMALWGSEAARRTILDWNESSELESFNVLHFATHAILEPDAPHWSRIMLADDDLTVLDVMDLKLDAQLVILSACSSAVGAGGTGDELLGLARAFFYAGARALVASLWSVEDESTARLMRILYDNLKKGEPISRALRGAQLEMRRTGFAPFYWAPFVAIGSA